MKHAPFPRVIHWNWQATVRGWHLLVVGGLFLLSGWYHAARLLTFLQGTPSTATLDVWDALFLALGGPPLWDGTLLSMLGWFVPHLLFFYLIGEMVQGELAQQGVGVLPRIGSRGRWWLGKGVTLGLLAAAYLMWGLLATLLGAATRLPWMWQHSYLLSEMAPVPVSRLTALGWLVGLLWSTLLTLGLLQMVTALVTRRSIHGLLVVTVLLLLSWLVGTGNPSGVRWLPGSHSMLFRHSALDATVPHFPWEWSLLYNAVLTTTLAGVGTWVVGRLDVIALSDSA